jgi:hypothetical protein
MLKITLLNSGTHRRLILEGRLVLPWATELARKWSEVRDADHDLPLVVDVKDVTAIGQAGENILLAMMNEGARFFYGGLSNRIVLEQLARRCNRKDVALVSSLPQGDSLTS